MSFLTRNLKEDITVWRQDPAKDGFGNLTYQSPSFLKGRWEENSDLKFDLAGREVIPEAVVFLKEDVKQGDFLLLGRDTTASPTPTTEASEVRKFRKIPTLNRHHFERVAFL